MNDREIIELYWDRDERAIEETNTAYGAYCRTISKTILGNALDAEECVNDTYLHTWNSIPPQCPSKLSAFLGRITRNLSLDRARKNHAAKRGGGEYPLLLDELEVVLPTANNAEKAVEDAELSKAINAFLHTLSDKECAVFLQRYYYMRPVQSIADTYGMSEGSVKVTLHRTRKKLKTYLEKEDMFL